MNIKEITHNRSRYERKLASGVLLAILLLFSSLLTADNTMLPFRDFSSEIRVEILPIRRTTLSGELAARIIKISPREGQRFQEGNTLIAFDCDSEKAQLQRAQALLDAAEAKAQVHNRLSKLKATSKLEERVAKAQAAQAKAELAIIQVKINRCKIKAPYSGRVVTLFAHNHQYAKAGEPLMEILDEKALELVFLLPSYRISTLKKEDRFSVRIDETQRTYPATITTFGAMIDSVSQSIKVFATLEGSFPELLPGMSGLALLNTKKHPKP